jgi:purine-nucleoside/S-methyl-5'-thioadenosine phosphorylase / adenosine deaminase
MTPPFLTSPLLATPNLAHGFFGRAGGVSTGVYASLNVGAGSDDKPEDVKENRRRCATALGCDADRLVTNYQIHSSEVVIIDAPWSGAPAKADGLVTKTRGLALGVLAADCMAWLFADPEAGVIGAAHAGWRGALAGVLENTVAAMEGLGANRTNIRAALGPCLRQPNFEVGIDLVDAFTEKFSGAETFFAPGKSTQKRQLDLAGFGAWRLGQSGVKHIDDLGVCTLAAPEAYFSYRASQRAAETGYGRNLSAIAIR